MNTLYAELSSVFTGFICLHFITFKSDSYFKLLKNNLLGLFSAFELFTEIEEKLLF